MQREEMIDGLEHCLAYQTPPYEVKKRCEPPSPSPRSSCSKSPELLIGQIANLLFSLSKSRCTGKIKNNTAVLTRFLKEVLKRSKCNKRVTLLATLYFHKVNTALEDEVELPEFSKCAKRVFLSCLILAHKFLNDNTFSLKTWSLISGLNQKDLASMERWCLQKLDYKLLAAENELDNIQASLSLPSQKRAREDDPEEIGMYQTKLSKPVLLVS